MWIILKSEKQKAVNILFVDWRVDPEMGLNSCRLTFIKKTSGEWFLLFLSTTVKTSQKRDSKTWLRIHELPIFVQQTSELHVFHIDQYTIRLLYIQSRLISKCCLQYMYKMNILWSKHNIILSRIWHKVTGHYWYLLKMIVSIKTHVVTSNGELLIV